MPSSAVSVRNRKTPGRYADGNGLYLVVDDSGAKCWILRTVVTGKRRDIGLGSVRPVSLADARDEATRLRGRHHDGVAQSETQRGTSRSAPVRAGAGVRSSVAECGGE
jgi:hypothetical protein